VSSALWAQSSLREAILNTVKKDPPLAQELHTQTHIGVSNDSCMTHENAAPAGLLVGGGARERGPNRVREGEEGHQVAQK